MADHHGNFPGIGNGSGTRAVPVALAAYLAVWIISVGVFWLVAPGGAMTYSILFLWILLPVATLVACGVIGAGARERTGARLWALTPGFGVMYMLAEYMTFKLANTVHTGNINAPDWGAFVAGTLLALIGMGIGAIVHRLRSLD